MAPIRRPRRVLVVGATLAAVLAMAATGLLPVAASTPPQAVLGNLESSAAVPAGTAPRVVLGAPILTGFTLPVLFVPHGSTGYVVEQVGIIRRVTYNSATHAWQRAGIFLDIRARVTDPRGTGAGEQGLLGMALAPTFDVNGKFYVSYTAKSDGQDTVSQFLLKSPTVADPQSERLVLHVPDPYPDHNGGMLLFNGKYLYVSEGDGGSGGDPQNHAQSLNIRLGKILRIDPRDPDGNGPMRYSVPADNPFVGVAHTKPEIWAYGLRNPWRFSIDPPTGDLWIGDVGQCQFEEVDHAGDARGVNFGWRNVEGTHNYNTIDACGAEAVCSSNCETLPVAEYDHGSGCAITGGWVYRGTAYPMWQGRYLYGDYCSGKMWIIAASGSPGVPQDVTPSAGINPSSFARDAAGELYVTDLSGSIYQLQLTGTP